MVLVLALFGCATGSDETPTGGPGVGPGVSTTTPVGDTTASMEGTGSEGGSAGSGEGSEGLDETAGSDGPPPPGVCQGMVGTGVLGGVCTDGCDCASGRCFQISLGSACSECLSDVECMAAGAGTCSVDPSTDPPFARCTQGQLGVMCEPGSSGCQPGLVCTQLIDTQGFLPDYFCSECETAADCAGGGTCVPTVDINGGIALGYLHCAAPGSLEDGELCPLLPGGTGNGTPCASGRCAVTDIGGLGIAEIGVCSSCVDDVDCPAGQTCQDAEVDESGATPATCA